MQLPTKNIWQFLTGGPWPGERHSRVARNDGTVTLCTLRPAHRHCTVMRLLRRFWSSINKRWCRTHVTVRCHGTIADKHCTSHGGVASPPFRYPPPPKMSPRTICQRPSRALTELCCPHYSWEPVFFPEVPSQICGDNPGLDMRKPGSTDSGDENITYLIRKQFR